MTCDNRLLEQLEIQLPIIQAPMAGASGSAMAIAVSEAGGLGSLPCAMLDIKTIRTEISVIRQKTSKPFNLNFFAHRPAEFDPAREAAWKAKLATYYDELGVERTAAAPSINRAPFDEAICEFVEDLQPPVVSFHFGLPADPLIARVKNAGCVVLSTATTVPEARWLEEHGCDAIIAQGYEAGGHRGMFFTEDLASQVGTMALVPQIVDSVKVPVIAAGGIGDGRGVAAALALGASAVQVGTAYLFTPQSLITDLHRAALKDARNRPTALTNVFSGRPARGLVNRIMREIGPMSDLAPAFPTAGNSLAPLKAKAEAVRSSDFSSLWSGQAFALGHECDAGTLTLRLAESARQTLARLSPVN
jgi:nitronate monooxygenase